MGTTVVWNNTGAVAHTVTADDGQAFGSGTIDPETVVTPGIYIDRLVVGGRATEIALGVLA